MPLPCPTRLCELPDHDHQGEGLDQRVNSEAGPVNRARGEGCGDTQRDADHVPAPGQLLQAHAALEHSVPIDHPPRSFPRISAPAIFLDR